MSQSQDIVRSDPSHLDWVVRSCGVVAPGGLIRFVRAAAEGIADAISLLRSAPPLGDVGTRGNELTGWVVAWNRRGNPGDSKRE